MKKNIHQANWQTKTKSSGELSSDIFRFTPIFSVVFESLGKVVAYFPFGSLHYTEISKTTSWSIMLWLRSQHTTNFSETYHDKLHLQLTSFDSMLRCPLCWWPYLNLPLFPWYFLSSYTDLFFSMIHLTYYIQLTLEQGRIRRAYPLHRRKSGVPHPCIQAASDWIM